MAISQAPHARLRLRMRQAGNHEHFPAITDATAGAGASS
jgi:hypothetical protein